MFDRPLCHLPTCYRQKPLCKSMKWITTMKYTSTAFEGPIIVWTTTTRTETGICWTIAFSTIRFGFKKRKEIIIDRQTFPRTRYVFYFQTSLPPPHDRCAIFSLLDLRRTYRRPPSERAMCFSRRGVNRAAGVYREIVNDNIGGGWATRCRLPGKINIAQ